jgi:hypothetical protein
MSNNMDENTNLLQGGLNLREVILLDSQSATNIFCNPEFVENIRPANTLLCLNTNGGVLITTIKATVPSFGELWFNPDAIANIFCMADIDDKYGIGWAIVNGKKAIRVMTDPPVDFVRSPEKLYFFAPKQFRTNTELSDYIFVDSVEENRLFFTNRQFDRAKRARQLYHTLGSPSIKDYKGIIRMSCTKDNPVTTEDIEIAETIFGPDVGVRKGKSTQQRPTPVVADYVDIPEELLECQQNVTPCIDTNVREQIGIFRDGVTKHSVSNRRVDTERQPVTSQECTSRYPSSVQSGGI